VISEASDWRSEVGSEASDGEAVLRRRRGSTTKMGFCDEEGVNLGVACEEGEEWLQGKEHGGEEGKKGLPAKRRRFTNFFFLISFFNQTRAFW
jgi:hypothetical protein